MKNLQILDAIDGKTINSNFLNFLLRNKALTQSVIKIIQKKNSWLLFISYENVDNY